MYIHSEKNRCYNDSNTFLGGMRYKQSSGGFVEEAGEVVGLVVCVVSLHGL